MTRIGARDYERWWTIPRIDAYVAHLMECAWDLHDRFKGHAGELKDLSREWERVLEMD